LRHNFKSSAWLSLEEIKNRRDNTDEATISSVMDYAPLLFFAGGHANLRAWRQSNGDYGVYLANRITALLRPVFAFVLAWLIVPLALEALDAPEGTINSVGQLVLQPLRRPFSRRRQSTNLQRRR